MFLVSWWFVLGGEGVPCFEFLGYLGDVEVGVGWVVGGVLGDLGVG